MNYNAVKYVRKYFKLKFLSYYEQLDRKEVDSLVYAISDKLFGKKYNKDNLKKGKSDQHISNLIESYIKDHFNELWVNRTNLKNMISKYILSNYSVNYSSKTLDCIVDRIISKLISSYDYEEMLNGKFDDEIVTSYKEVADQLCNEMRQYIIHFIAVSIIPINNINVDEVAEDMVRTIMTTKEKNIVDLLTGKYDSILEYGSYRNRKQNQDKIEEKLRTKELEEKNISAAKEYVFKYVREVAIERFSANLLVKVSEGIYNKLLSDGKNPRDIVNGLCDTEINTHYDRWHTRWQMKNNSVIGEVVPEPIEYGVKKKKLHTTVISLLLAGTLLTANTVGLVGDVYNSVSTYYENQKYATVAVDYVGFDYQTIFTEDTRAFDPTVMSVLDSYVKYEKYGNVSYDYLGFYNAYINVKGDNKLIIMDKMLSAVRREAYGDSRYSEFLLGIDGMSCYLEFMYFQLESMGCEEITEPRYREALMAYLEFKRDNPGERNYTEVMDARHIRTIERVGELYREYSEKCLVEVGKLITIDGDVYSLQFEDDRRRFI